MRNLRRTEMSLFKLLSTALLLLVFFTAKVLAGPGGDLDLVNFTPYDWKLTYKHSYQMTWEPTDLIPAGSNFKQYVEYYKWRETGDCAAEAIYELVGSPGPASFMVKERQSKGKRILIEYNEHLASLGSPGNSVLDLGFDWDGAVLFVLSGNGSTPYVGAQPPAAWMQATLPNIGDKSLRQIAMPLSHDAGMSEIDMRPWFSGVWHNVCTQEHSIFEQLHYGARWFDIRPFLRSGRWFTGHFSRTIGNAHVGGTGRSIDDIVSDINTFTSQHPGELIVLELSHELKFRELAPRWNTDFGYEDWKDLYDKLSHINHLWTPSEALLKALPEDLTSVPLSTFIQPGSKSAVLIRIPRYAPPATGPTAYAFVRDHHLRYTGSYSDTKDPAFLASDQLAKLKSNRIWPDCEMHRTTYTITQKGAQVSDVSNWKKSIVGLSYLAHRVLLGDLWGALSERTYPNLVEVDNLHNGQVTALCMAINERYADAEVNRVSRRAVGRNEAVV